MIPELDAADRLALDWISEQSWQRIVLWGDDVRLLASAVRSRWPDADIAMWNDWVGEPVPGVADVDTATDADIVLVRLPKALAALDAWTHEIARLFPDATLLATGRLKYMTLAQNDVLERCYAQFDVSHARQKSRLLIARDARAEVAPLEPELRALDASAGAAAGLTVAAVGGVFAGPSLDIGTRALLETLTERLPVDGADEAAIDLGCGTGVVASWLARRGYRVRASDRSRAAVASTTFTAAANGVAERVDVRWEDALAGVPAGTASLIVLNPPFHEGTRVTVDPAHRLFAAAARALAPGGELVVVWNSHLQYRGHLERLVGPTEQWARTAKFTVTRSVRQR